MRVVTRAHIVRNAQHAAGSKQPALSPAPKQRITRERGRAQRLRRSYPRFLFKDLWTRSQMFGTSCVTFSLFSNVGLHWF